MCKKIDKNLSLNFSKFFKVFACAHREIRDKRQGAHCICLVVMACVPGKVTGVSKLNALYLLVRLRTVFLVLEMGCSCKNVSVRSKVFL